MISKKYKLPIQDFTKEKPLKVLRSSFFTLKVFESGLSYSRFGVIISGSTIKKAFQRNKTRRAIFDRLRLDYDKLPTSNYLFILKNTAKDVELKSLLANLEEVLKQIKVVSKF